VRSVDRMSPGRPKLAPGSGCPSLPMRQASRQQMSEDCERPAGCGVYGAQPDHLTGRDFGERDTGRGEMKEHRGGNQAKSRTPAAGNHAEDGI